VGVQRVGFRQRPVGTSPALGTVGVVALGKLPWGWRKALPRLCYLAGSPLSRADLPCLMPPWVEAPPGPAVGSGQLRGTALHPVVFRRCPWGRPYGSPCPGAAGEGAETHTRGAGSSAAEAGLGRWLLNATLMGHPRGWLMLVRRQSGVV